MFIFGYFGCSQLVTVDNDVWVSSHIASKTMSVTIFSKLGSLTSGAGSSLLQGSSCVILGWLATLDLTH